MPSAVTADQDIERPTWRSIGLSPPNTAPSVGRGKGRKVGFDGSMRTVWQTRGGRSASSSRCPINLRSGYYAAKLETTKNQYHISFFVRPKEGRPTADIAFLVRTFRYPAYGVTGPTEFSSTALSQYSRHEDWGGVFYSSRLRPITRLQAAAGLTTRLPDERRPDLRYTSRTMTFDADRAPVTHSATKAPIRSCRLCRELIVAKARRESRGGRP